MADQVLTALQKATRGLLYPSETDAPIEPFVWEAAKNTAATVRRLAGQPAGAKPKALSLDDFFVDLTEEEPFARLRQTLEDNLKDVRVYRFGTTDATYYVVGTDADGRLAGVKTEATET
jgi:hypothetical protein